MIDVATLVTIVGMAVVTYLTRALGFLLLRNRTLGPQLTQVLNAAPGCVLIAVIAPKFVSGHPADLIALGLTVYAAARFSLLPVVVFAIVVTGLLRVLLPAWRPVGWSVAGLAAGGIGDSGLGIRKALASLGRFAARNRASGSGR